MPELPEVETMRRGVLPVIGARIAKVATGGDPRLKPIQVRPALPAFRRRVTGAQIADVGRVGKRVTLLLSTHDRIVLEPRMTGLVLLAQPPDQEHLRLTLKLQGSEVERLMFWDRRGLGSVRVFSPPEFAVEFGPDRLGPDALAVSSVEFRRRLASSRREIKVALLDQRAVAGVGNLYASEILHVARLHPQRACNSLRGADWLRLHAALCQVLEEAVRYEGSTLGDGTYRNALNQIGEYQNHHRVYGKAGEACPDCRRSSVVRIVQAQRSTFYCPRCQRAPRPRRRERAPRRYHSKCGEDASPSLIRSHSRRTSESPNAHISNSSLSRSRIAPSSAVSSSR